MPSRPAAAWSAAALLLLAGLAIGFGGSPVEAQVAVESDRPGIDPIPEQEAAEPDPASPSAPAAANPEPASTEGPAAEDAAGAVPGPDIPKIDPVSVAVIDFRGVLSRSDAAKSIREVVDARRAEYREEFAAIEKELVDEQKALVQKRTVMAQAAFDAEVARLKERERRAQQDAQLRNQQLKEAFDTALDKVQKELLEVVAALAEEAGIGVVLFRSSIVLAVKKLEISDEALARLNQKLQRVDVVFEPLAE